MKPATSFCLRRRLPGMRRSTSTSPPTATITARQIKRRLTTMRTQNLLRVPLPELADEGEDTSYSHKRQRSQSYRDRTMVVNSSELTNLRDALAPTRMNKPELVGPLTLQECIGAQPQGDVGGLHRLAHHSYHFIVQRLQVRLVPELRGEGFERLRRVVLPTVEAAVYER